MALAQIIPFRPQVRASQADSIARGERAADVMRSSKEENSRVEKLVSSDKNIIESDKKLLNSQDKLRTNLEKLVKAIADSAKSSGKLSAVGRADEFAKSQKIDYRSTGTMIKEAFTGRGGNKYDPNSLRYKFGTLRGLASTTGLVSRGDGKFADNLLARREERLQGSETLQKLNPQMKNLKQFGGDQAKVAKFYDNKMRVAQEAARKLQEEQDKLETLRASGMSDEEIARTTGGKRTIAKRDEAFAGVLDVDSRLRGEKNATLEQSKLDAMSKAASQPVESDKVVPLNADLNENQLEAIKMQEGQTAAFTELLEVTKAEASRKTDADAALLMAVKGIEIPKSEGGGVSSMIDTATDLVGKGSKGAKVAGAASKVGKLAKLGKVAKIGGAITAIGMGAYEAYSGFTDAEQEVQEGKITQDEGDIKKSAAIGKGTGGASGAIAGAAAGAAIGSVVPVVGTAIGGLIGGGLGYFGGSAVGEKVGEYGSKAYKSIFGTREEKAEADKLKQASTMPKSDTIKQSTSDVVKSKTVDNEMAKMDSKGNKGTTIVSAPTNNITKQTSNNMIKTPTRHQDPSIQSYYKARYI